MDGTAREQASQLLSMSSPVRSFRMPRRALAGTAATILALTILAACSEDGGEPTDGANGEPDQVTYLTSFGQLGRDAYVYVAQELGYFEDAGIEVTIEPGSGTGGNSQALASGQADFVVLDLSGGIVARSQGAEDLTVIAAIHQLPPVALMATEPDITSPVDLEGTQVGIAPGTVTELLFPIYVEAANGDPDAIEVIPTNFPDLIPALASGRVVAIEQFAMGEPTVEAAVGTDVQVLPYSDYLTDLYGVVLVTTPGLVQSDPDLCARFRDALLRGLQYSLDNPQQAGEILASFVPEQDAAIAAQELEIMRSYSLPSVGPLGTIDADKVMRSIALLQSLGAIDAATAMQPEDLVAFDLVPSE